MKYNPNNNPLASLFNGGNMLTTNSPPSGIGNFNAPDARFSLPLQNETLPNGGGTYNPAGGGITPAAPIVPSAPTTNPQTGGSTDLYEKYRDPKTGEVMSPEEYALSLGDKVPKGNGQIPNYAGDAMTNPDQSANELIGRATDLNNARNDIATGETDPYGVGNKSGIAYSPAELKAIESAYAGVYDPAIKDVFSRLRDKQDSDAKQQAKEDIVFKTNEAIRQWQATTGSSGGYNFTSSQIANGASRASMELADFKALESDDLKNFFINMPNDIDPISKKSFPMDVVFDNLITQVMNKKIDSKEAAEEMAGMGTTQAVKTYYINKIPEMQPEEQNYFMREVWSRLPFVK